MTPQELEYKLNYVDTQLNNSIAGLKLYGKNDIKETMKRLEKARDKIQEIKLLSNRSEGTAKDWIE